MKMLFNVERQMSLVVLLALMTSSICTSLHAMSQSGRMIYGDSLLDDMWMTFKITYNKLYDDQLEDSLRRSVWQLNVDYIQKHNLEADLGLHSFTLGINEYADLTLDEYRKLLLGARVPPLFNATRQDLHVEVVEDVPDTVDWRTQGYVTPIKNQGPCGSCWAFSSTGSLEGQNFQKTGKLVSLSEQNLVDCSKTFGNEGCNGGWMSNAFKYVGAEGGIDTESSYQYEAHDDTCRFQSSQVGAKCTGFRTSPRGDEQALKTMVAAVGPISVAIDAAHSSFQLYKSGVYDEPACSSSVDHAVLIVGYGNYNGLDYWLVKNSWGTSWGSDGYIMMSRNKKDQCAIADYAIYPTM